MTSREAIKQKLTEFISDASTDYELQKKYSRTELRQTIRRFIGYTTAELIKDNIITFTDLQTDIRTLLDETEKS
jgi:hypothetical protein